MKHSIKKSVYVFAVVFTAVTASADTCSSAFMHDPCALDGYSIVDTETFVKGTHNTMHILHDFGKSQRATKRHRRRYAYVRKCRLVKVRR